MEIQQTIFDGLQGVEILTDTWRLVLVTECGPRIAFLGKAGTQDNILYWDKGGASRGDWRLYGGHRVWITRPDADESEDAYAPDNAPCAVKVEEGCVTATAPAHPFTQLERSIRVQVLADGQFAVTNLIRNAGGMISSGGVWSPTCINPAGKEIRIPLGEEGSTWDMIHLVIPRVFAGNTARVDDPQVCFENDALVVRPAGLICKRCVSAPQGIISMWWPEQNITFTKKVRYQRSARYPLGGCNVAVFVGAGNWMGELETYGPEQSIRPGETIQNEEIWMLQG